MAGIGIVNNPRSRRNLRRPEIARRLRVVLDGEGEVADASTPEELAEVVDRFKRSRIDILGINGGDGTGHVVLTAFAQAYGDAPLPRVALLRGGAMNNVASSNHLRGKPESILRELVSRQHRGEAYRIIDRDLLQVRVDGGPPRYGFIFGTGVVVAFLDAYYATRRPSRAMAALLLVRAFGSALVGGRFAAELSRRDPVRVVTDGDEWADESYLAVLAGSVQQLGFGFSPLARCDEQPGFFHAVGVTGSPLQIAASLPQIWLGRPWRRRVAMDSVARELTIEPREPMRLTVDGDLYRAERQIRVTIGPPVGIIHV